MGRTRLKTAPRLGVAALGGNTAISKKLRKGRKSATKLLTAAFADSLWPCRSTTHRWPCSGVCASVRTETTCRLG